MKQPRKKFRIEEYADSKTAEDMWSPQLAFCLLIADLYDLNEKIKKSENKKRNQKKGKKK